MRRAAAVLAASMVSVCVLTLLVVFARTSTLTQAEWAIFVATAFAGAWISGAEVGKHLP